jgi:four helix bundle suffix protein
MKWWLDHNMISRIHQTIFLLRGQLRSQEETFLRDAGFSENLHRQRQIHRRRDGGFQRLRFQLAP